MPRNALNCITTHVEVITKFIKFKTYRTCFYHLVNFFYIINHLDLFISMTVDNRNQDDEDGYSSQKMPNPNSKCDFKENDALSIQMSPLEKVINSKYK